MVRPWCRFGRFECRRFEPLRQGCWIQSFGQRRAQTRDLGPAVGQNALQASPAGAAGQHRGLVGAVGALVGGEHLDQLVQGLGAAAFDIEQRAFVLQVQPQISHLAVEFEPSQCGLRPQPLSFGALGGRGCIKGLAPRKALRNAQAELGHRLVAERKIGHRDVGGTQGEFRVGPLTGGDCPRFGGPDFGGQPFELRVGFPSQRLGFGQLHVRCPYRKRYGNQRNEDGDQPSG